MGIGKGGYWIQFSARPIPAKKLGDSIGSELSRPLIVRREANSAQFPVGSVTSPPPTLGGSGGLCDDE